MSRLRLLLFHCTATQHRETRRFPSLYDRFGSLTIFGCWLLFEVEYSPSVTGGEIHGNVAVLLLGQPDVI